MAEGTTRTTTRYPCRRAETLICLRTNQALAAACWKDSLQPAS